VQEIQPVAADAGSDFYAHVAWLGCLSMPKDRQSSTALAADYPFVGIAQYIY
jgi:hypothetical protein